MARFLDPLVAQQHDGGQHQHHGRHAEDDALCQNEADIFAEREVHRAEGEKARDGREAGAGERFERRDDGDRHRVTLVVMVLPLLDVAVIEEDGVVHRHAELQDGGDGLRDVRYFAEYDICAEIVENGDADVGDQHQRQHPRFEAERHCRQRERDRQRDEDRQFLIDEFFGVLDDHREAREVALVVEQRAHGVDGVHCLLRRARLFVLNDHHRRALFGEEDVAELGGDHVGRHLHADDVGEPQRIADAGDLFDLV